MIRLIPAITAALLIAAGSGLSQQPVPASTSTEKPKAKDAQKGKSKKSHEAEKPSHRPGGTVAALDDGPTATAAPAATPGPEAERGSTRTLPKTGSPYPLVLLAGICALIASGLLWAVPRWLGRHSPE